MAAPSRSCALLHVAIIPDGNGRWAQQRGRPRQEGHRAGVEAVRRVLAAAPELDIGHLTLFAFSSDNWERPAKEVEAILGLLRDFFLDEARVWAGRDIRVRAIGRRDRLSPALRAAIATTEEATAAGRGLQLRIAVDYSAREEILRAAARFYTTVEISQAALGRMLARVSHAGDELPDVDLLIRTGGEHRISDFLLWECAYAELIFSPKMWPEFSVTDLKEALREFHARQRRFGRLPEAAAG